MKKTKPVILSLFAILCLASCNNNGGGSSTITPSVPLITTNTSSITPTTSNNPTSNPTSTPTTTPTPTTPVGPTGIQTFDNYDQYIDEYSESGHLYIHYLREGASMDEYNEYGLWLWPTSKAGGLFAASTTPSGMRANTTSWMSKIGVNGSIDQAGVCADIDLNSDSYVTGQKGEPFSLANLNRIGFLVVLLSSMSGGSHWTSDGSADAFMDGVLENVRTNGSVHVFLTKGNVQSPSFYYSKEVYTNPVITDTTGQYRSEQTISNSSTTTYGKSSTASYFSDTGAVGYHVFVPSFADSDGDGFGDLQGVINKLDYLESLNIDTLWLSPFLKSNSYHGYDTVDYFTIDERFGNEDVLMDLIYSAHKKGIKVLMDMVINHSSLSSLWFSKAQRNETGTDKYGNAFKYRDLFHFKFKGDTLDDGTLVENSSSWYKDGESNYYYYAKFASDMPEFNYDAQITRDLILQVSEYWLGFGIDGYRMDAVKHIYMADESSKSSSDVIIEDKGTRTYYDDQLGREVTVDYDYSTNKTKNIAFWKEYSNRIKQIYPNCFLVAENFDGWDERISEYYDAFDSQLDFAGYYHNYEYPYRDNIASQLSSVDNNDKFAIYKNQRNDFINSGFTSNHDVMRAINHINGDTGSITGTTSEIGRAKVQAALTILQPGISFVYYGDELGMSSNTDENTTGNDNNIDRYYRQPMLWADNDTSNTSFSFGEGYQIELDSYNQGIGNVTTQTSDLDSMLNLYRLLTNIKSSEDFPNNGEYQGFNYEVNGNVIHYMITPKAGNNDQTTYKFYINTGGSSGSGNAPWGLDPNTETAILKYNADDSTIRPFGIVVTKVNK